MQTYDKIFNETHHIKIKMSYYIFNKNNHIYCEPLHSIYAPEMAAVGYDTEDRARRDAKIAGLGNKTMKIRFLKGIFEIMEIGIVSSEQKNKSFAFMPFTLVFL